MEYTTLGRTGLKVSAAGLGCGGFSPLHSGVWPKLLSDAPGAHHTLGKRVLVRAVLDRLVLVGYEYRRHTEWLKPCLRARRDAVPNACAPPFHRGWRSPRFNRD